MCRLQIGERFMVSAEDLVLRLSIQNINKRRTDQPKLWIFRKFHCRMAITHTTNRDNNIERKLKTVFFLFVFLSRNRE